MDAMIRPGVSAPLALAAALALAPPGAGAATAGVVQDAVPPTPARKAAAPSAGHAAKAGARPRQPGPLASGPRAPSQMAPPLALGPRKPLDLTLTPAEFSTILGRYPADSDDGAHRAFDDVTVLAPTELQPMRDPAHEVWGGIAAPVWALMHPTQAWRIFFPIPPK